MITVNDFKNDEVRRNFHNDMFSRIHDYDSWDHAEVEKEVFHQAEKDFNFGQTVVYEIPSRYTISNNPVTISLTISDFQVTKTGGNQNG